MNAAVDALCGDLAAELLDRGWKMAAAESCTGGLIAAACTDLAGSSAWFERGFVTYSNEAKSELLHVDPAAIASHGAVSEVVARAMAFGALRHSHAQCSVAVTGVAGPSGGTPAKPVGTVCFAWATKGRPARAETKHFAGDREAVRRQSVDFSLAKVLEVLDEA